MGKKLTRQFVLLPFSVLTFFLPESARAQFVYSAFAEASVAHAAVSGLGIDFAAGNPAILGEVAHGRRFAYMLTATDSNIRATFKNALPDFALQIVISPRLSIALAQSERAPFSTALANRSLVDDPALEHPLGFLIFTYKQDWSAGIGFQLKSNLSVGVAMRHESYTVFPANLGIFSLGQSFRTFDLGIRRSGKRLNLGLVFRNLVSNRTTQPFSQPLLIIKVVDPSNVIVWHPIQFEGIRFEPQFALEGGMHWLVSSHWQLLGDISSNEEYALGLRWRVFSKLFITTGTGKRFDRIYADAAATYTTLGGQFQTDKFALGLAWVISTRSGRNRLVSMPYGAFNLSQIVNKRLLIAGALSL